MINRVLMGLLSSLLGLASVQAQSPAPLPAGESFHVVVIGSSTAAGVGPSHPREAWVNRYRQWLKGQHPHARVTNLAVGGYQTYHLLPDQHPIPARRPRPDRKRNISMAISLHPDLIILNAPSNDVVAGYGVDEQRQNVLAITRTAQRAGIPIWVSSTQPRMLAPEQVAIQEQMRDWILSYYTRRGLDFWTPLADCAGWIKSEFDSGDGTHVNGAGHALLFEQVQARIPVSQ